jgi:5'-nucleotidase
VSAHPAACLVTNDDGIGSEGLRYLAVAAVAAGLHVVVAAPDGEASGSGSAMKAVAAGERVVVSRRELDDVPGVPAYAVAALPAFIAFTGARGAFGPRPDLVLSGINRGPNTGTAILHSGTVGAAMTAVTAGLPAAAFSLGVDDQDQEQEQEHWATAAGVAAEIIPALPRLQAGVLLNVNVPNVPADRLRGLRRGPLASAGTVKLMLTGNGENSLSITLHDNRQEPAPGTDAALVAAGYASVTAVRPVCQVAASNLPWPAAAQASARRR